MRNTLAQRRSARSLSQDDLARLAGVSRQTINTIERGRYEPRLQLAFRLAAIFECRIEDLFVPDEEAGNSPFDPAQRIPPR